MILAIFCHKWAEAIAVGVSFAKNLDSVGLAQTHTLLGLFSCFTPLGIIIGIMLSGINDGVTAVLMGLSAGTFIYIACFW